MTPRPLTSPPSVHVHIERLVLDGVPLASAEVPRFQAALGKQLGHLLALAPIEALSGGAIAQLQSHPVYLVSGNTPTTLGRQVGEAVAASLFPTAPLLPSRPLLQNPSPEKAARPTETVHEA